MPITIDGNGTIGGITAGGLPDGTADAEAAEASRATIRTKYATMQTSIENAVVTADIKTALDGGAA